MSKKKQKQADRGPGPRRRRPREWTNRLPDGRLRVQCCECYRAGLDPTYTYRVCDSCRARLSRKKAEMDRFRMMMSDLELVDQLEGNGVAGDGASAPPATGLPSFDPPFPFPPGYAPGGIV